jgi:DnaJ-domain-containing protein 1
MAWLIPLPIGSFWFDVLLAGLVIFIFFRRSAMRKIGRAVGRGRIDAARAPREAPQLPAKAESVVSRDLRALDLKPGASYEEIKNAYRELAKVWHPDRFGNDAKLRERANAKLGEINAAYERLKDHFQPS